MLPDPSLDVARYAYVKRPVAPVTNDINVTGIIGHILLLLRGRRRSNESIRRLNPDESTFFCRREFVEGGCGDPHSLDCFVALLLAMTAIIWVRGPIASECDLSGSRAFTGDFRSHKPNSSTCEESRMVASRLAMTEQENGGLKVTYNRFILQVALATKLLLVMC
jgi:hypothetical protein